MEPSSVSAPPLPHIDGITWVNPDHVRGQSLAAAQALWEALQPKSWRWLIEDTTYALMRNRHVTEVNFVLGLADDQRMTINLSAATSALPWVVVYRLESDPDTLVMMREQVGSRLTPIQVFPDPATARRSSAVLSLGDYSDDGTVLPGTLKILPALYLS